MRLEYWRPQAKRVYGLRNPARHHYAHGKVTEVDYLISNDNTKLVHMDTLDLTKDPANAIPIAGRPIRGNPNAKVTIVNFDDLECPYCARMHAAIVSGDHRSL